MYISVDAAMAAIGCDRAKAISIFKLLDSQKVAKFMIGRRGWPTRLESN